MSRAACASVHHTPRQVIEGKLLAALDDESKVAVLFSHEDLNVLIGNMRSKSPEAARMIKDLKQLRAVAFASQEGAAP